ncbi:hypothetical protein HanIR_Chr14g0697231 [Helianthus annuus]|nr:hypothetical protein HanIR_Chr14g0697231 [Helianthus annuus]
MGVHFDGRVHYARSNGYFGKWLGQTATLVIFPIKYIVFKCIEPTDFAIYVLGDLNKR